MKILAFDQATQKTGFAVFSGSSGENCDTMLEYGTIDLHKEKDAETRVKAMTLEIFKLLKEREPDVVVVEDVAMQKNVATLVMLARLQGAVIAYCMEHEITWTVLKPSVWRKRLHFKQGTMVKQKELKRQAVDYVKTYYGVDASEDEADAICIGTACASFLC